MKRFISGSYNPVTVNVSVFELKEKGLGFENNGPKKNGPIVFLIFFRRKLGKLDQLYTNILSVNSVKFLKLFDFTRNRIYL